MPVKERKWVVKPSPGPHSINTSLPLLVILRDILKIVDSAREGRRVISEGRVLIDGKVRKDYKFPVGFFDTISIPDLGEHYRVVPTPTKIIGLIKISEEEIYIKPLRIENKTTLKGGHIQLNLFGGYNILVNREEISKRPYKTFDTVLVSLKDMKIIDHIPLQENNIAVIVGGRNIGRLGYVRNITPGMRHYRTIVSLEDLNKHLFQTVLTYVYIIGRDKPVVKLS